MEINGCFFMKKYGEVEDMNLEINYYHVDVFADEKYAGNGLTVVLLKEELAKEKMQMIAKEFKQFETIFLQLTDRNICRARIFTIDEELDFAGHPILGAGAVIHAAYFEHENAVEVEFVLNNKEVKVTSKKKENKYQVEMNQGQFLQRPSVIKARNDQKTGEVYVAGDVVILVKGYMLDL